MLDWTRCGDHLQDIVRDVITGTVGFGTQDRLAGFQVGRLDVGGQPPFEARTQPFFQGQHGFGRPVGGDDNLFILSVQGIERMEEFFLGRFLAGDKLDVVDQQYIDPAVFVPEGLRGMEADGVDQVVGKFFRRDIQHLLAAP